jgi:prolyl 4-hydroxylase
MNNNLWTKNELKCKYVNNDSPYLLIGPVKEERVSMKPFIAIYHDVVTHRQAEHIKHFAIPNVRSFYF